MLAGRTRYLAYRKIRPLYNFWVDIGVYQRNLTNFQESAILFNNQSPFLSHTTDPCVNCHTFCNNRTDRMTLGIRSAAFGSSTPFALNGSLEKLGAKFGYMSWHPSGRLIAYSLNDVRQFFHQAGTEVRDVVDLDSDLLYYEVGSRSAKTHPAFSEPDRLETYPAWSPDGRFLYFCSAPILWTDRDSTPPERYEEVRYNLRRIPYDIETDTWGPAEIVLSPEKTGLSILLPRISPDGKYLLFCMTKYGCFPVYQPSSDLYLMDLDTGKVERLAINSERSESWHSWSSNGRWFAFSSKRRDGLFTRIYLSYFDTAGQAHPPLLVPQEDPTFYDFCLNTYTVPELTVEPVKVSEWDIAKAVASPRRTEIALPDISMTRKPAKPATWKPAVPERE
jgi:Tol biopolymer transport system component